MLRHLCNKIVIIVGFGIFYCTGGIDQLGDMLLAMAGQNGTGWLDTMLVTSVQNNLFLLIAALLCCFPLLELPKKIMAKIRLPMLPCPSPAQCLPPACWSSAAFSW